MDEDKKCCGTCLYHFCENHDNWVCANIKGNYYTCETDYDDTCTDWEER